MVEGRTGKDKRPIFTQFVLADDMLPATQVPNLTRRLINGQMVNWADSDYPSALAQQMYGFKITDFTKLVPYLMLVETEQADLGLDMLSNYFESEGFDNSNDLAKPSLFKYLGLLSIGQVIQGGLEKNLGSPRETSDASSRFIGVVEQKKQGLAQAILATEFEHLNSLVKLLDFNGYLTTNLVVGSGLRQAIVNDYLASIDSIPNKDISLALRASWERLDHDWTFQQVMDMVGACPKLIQNGSFRTVAVAVENNLVNGLIDQVRTFRLADFTSDFWGGLVMLSGYRWVEARNYLTENYPDFLSFQEQPIKVRGFDVPRQYLPSVAFELLTEISHRLPEEEFLPFIGANVLEAAKQPESAQLWLGLMLALQERLLSFDASHQPTAELMIQYHNWTKLPEASRDILADLKPGRIWLTTEGRIKPIGNPSRIIKDAYPIYESSAVAEKTAAQAEAAPVAETKPSLEINPDRVAQVPVLGEVAVVDAQAGELIREVIGRRKFLRLDEEALFDQFFKLQNRISDLPAQILFIEYLNQSSQLFNLAAQLGLESVYLREGKVTLVWDELESHSLNDQQTHLAVEGEFGKAVDGNFQLQIAGLENYTPEHFYLNNLIHQLVVQEVSAAKDWIDDSRFRTEATGVRERVKDFNRYSGYSKIEINGDSFIAVTLPSQEVVLVSQK